MCQRRKEEENEEKKGGEETTEGTSKNSEELEGKGQGAYERGRLFAAKAKRKVIASAIGDYSCTTNLCIDIVGVVKEWDPYAFQIKSITYN